MPLHPPVFSKATTSSCTGSRAWTLMFIRHATKTIKQTNVHTYTHLPVYNSMTHHAKHYSALLVWLINHYTDTTSTSSSNQATSLPRAGGCCHRTTTMLHDERLPHSPYSSPPDTEEDLPTELHRLQTRNSHLTTMSLLEISQQSVSTAATTRTSALVGQAHD